MNQQPANKPEVESEEQEQGKEIEVKEEHLPSRAAAIHEQIREEGQKELERDALALLLSAVAAGLSMGASLMAKGIFHLHLAGLPGAFLLENLGYTVGFIIVIMARQQLFTENTVTAVLPILHKPSGQNLFLLLRLWSLVLLGNLIGTGLAALAFTHLSVFDGLPQQAFISISEKVMEKSPGAMFSCAVVSGWIIATMVWMLPNANGARLWLILMMTWLVALGDLTHIVVGSVEVLFLLFNGKITLMEFFWPFALPVLAGNIIGGTFIFALISHAQIRSDLSRSK